MPNWWTRLTSSPRALIAVGAVVLAIAFGATYAALSGGSDEDKSSSSAKATGTAATPGGTGTPKSNPTALPPNKDKYCPAFEAIRAGGFATDPNDDSEGVDLDTLGRKFDELIGKYKGAERVAPRSLRDDYGLALGYLREGRKAVRSKDVALLQALVQNLDTLNDSMDAIVKKSRAFCG